jgi:hypothetical protein
MSFLLGVGYLFVGVILVCNLALGGYLIFSLIKRNKLAPYVWSFGQELRLMKEHLHLKKDKKIVDLWCGDGKALRFFSKEFGLLGDGFDINFFAIWLGKFLNKRLWFSASVRLFKKNFEAVDLKGYDYVYIYLLPPQLASIEDRLWKSVKKDVLIISNSFQFKKHKPFEVISNKKGKKCLFLYKR